MACTSTLSLSSNGHFPQIRICFRSDIPDGCAPCPATTMSSLKRSRSSSPQLTSHISHHSPSVTIFELSSHQDDIKSTPRRSKRGKMQHNTEIPQSDLNVNNLTHDVLADNPAKSRKVSSNATTPDPALPSPSKRRDVQTSPKKFKAIAQSLATPHPPPSRWKEIYDTIKHMRSRFVAPVDTMGCDRAQFQETDPKVIKDLFYSWLNFESTPPLFFSL